MEVSGMSDWYDAVDQLTRSANQALDADDAIEQAKQTDQVIADACEVIQTHSQRGEIEKRHVNQLAGKLSDIFPNLTKTGIKDELQDYFVKDASEGQPFDEILDNRLDEIQIVRTTDKKQQPTFRYHFTNPDVEIEDDGDGDGHLHYAHPAFRQRYFDAILAIGEGEEIGKPTPELRDSDDWKTWFDDTFLLDEHNEYVDTQKHVGPRTQAVRQLRDWIGRQMAYSDIEDAVERTGVHIDTTEESELDDLNPETTVNIPVDEIERICEQVGITSRALQIELDALGVTDPDVSGVSNPQYVNGQRRPYWAVTLKLAEPRDLIHDPKTPAEQVRENREEKSLSNQSDVGAVDSTTAALFEWLFEDGPDTAGIAPVGQADIDEGENDDIGLIGSDGPDLEEVSDDD